MKWKICILEEILKLLILSCEFPSKHIPEEQINMHFKFGEVGPEALNMFEPLAFFPEICDAYYFIDSYSIVAIYVWQDLAKYLSSVHGWKAPELDSGQTRMEPAKVLSPSKNIVLSIFVVGLIL